MVYKTIATTIVLHRQEKKQAANVLSKPHLRTRTLSMVLTYHLSRLRQILSGSVCECPLLLHLQAFYFGELMLSGSALVSPQGFEPRF